MPATLRKPLAFFSTVVVAISLSGCAQANDYACEGFVGGTQVNSIQVSAQLDQQPTLSFPSPLTAESVQTKVIVEGSGPVFTGRNLVEFEYAGYNGGTGELIQQTEFDGSASPAGFFGPNQVPNFCQALAGAKEGSRVVTIIPAKDAHDGQGIPGLGVGQNDSFIFVFDIKRVYLDKATGIQLSPEAGLPAVVTAPTGIPGITIPNTQAPSELKISQLIRGSGELVEMGQRVTMHYSGFLWDGATKFDSSWDSGQPVQFDIVEGGLIEGFLQAVVGQPVGSQVLAVIPPELGYGNTGAGIIPPGATLIFVIDILGVSK